MKRPELLARLFITVTAIGVVVIPFIFLTRTPLIHARVAEHGGWSPDVLQAEAGQPLRLRLTSDDVVHGFAVGQMDGTEVDVLPGQVTEVTLVFDKPGTYTYYCTRWCGPNHWRMRGTIEVSGSSPDSEPATAPLYVTLGLDLDAPHDSPVVPAQRPSALRGRSLAANLLLAQLADADYYQSHSPYQANEDLKTAQLSEQQIWDVVAFLWQSNTTPAALADGRRLYARNCAACHGETGGGDGVFATQLAAPGSPGMPTQGPANFSDPQRMLGASPALLQGKIQRGGMGTGMPMWGTVFTDEQVRDLVAYLYSFQFDYP
jgi:mono/diheme cytochrome c family protein/plastocyanin